MTIYYYLKKIKSVVIIFCDFERRVKDLKYSNLSLFLYSFSIFNYVRTCKYKLNPTKNIDK